MKNTGYKPEAKKLRQKAEASLKKKTPEKTPLSKIDTIKLIHELEVHQIELEMQNEELVQAKEELAMAADKKYHALYDSAPAGYFTLSREGEITESNLCGSRMLGREREHLKGSRMGFFITEDTRPAFNLFLKKVYKSKVTGSCEVTLLNNTDELKHIYVTGILAENGEQCLVTMVDITERKRAIEATIENQRLGAIGAMASSVAHDFNNVLQTISGNLELALLDQELKETTLHYLKTIKNATNDAAARVQMLQRFGGKKPERKQYNLVKLNALITETVTQLRPFWKDEAEKKGLDIVIQTKFHGDTQISGNEGELRTVLYNIVKNSIEAMPQGGNIFIETKEKQESVYVTVTDTGTGMNEETRARIFQPFYSTKGYDPGRGLGMSGVLSIIKEHDGNIYVKETTLGKGTAIEMVFPILRKGEVTEEMKTPEISSKAVNPMRVLWVEDDLGIAEVANELIKVLGHTGDIANGGKEALEYIEKNAYDLVITDIGMPQMNGWQLADIIKEKYNGKMKVAVVSGWDSEITEAEKLKHGVDYNIGKPFDISELKKMLAEVGD